MQRLQAFKYELIPDGQQARHTNFDSTFDSETMVKSGEQRHCGSGKPEHRQACTDLKWLEAQDSIKPDWLSQVAANARVAELVDALDLGSSAERREGSIPFSRTKVIFD